jgi:hypothetical protein
VIGSPLSPDGGETGIDAECGRAALQLAGDREHRLGTAQRLIEEPFSGPRMAPPFDNDVDQVAIPVDGPPQRLSARGR